MKMNWGTGLAIWLTVFVIAILTFVTFAFNQDVNLVNKEYYQKGVDFDHERDKRERGLSEENYFQIQQDEQFVILTIDSNFFSKITDVEAYFYRPSDRREDKHITFSSTQLSVPKTDLIQGRYELNILWNQNNTDYQLVKDLFLK